MAQQTFDLYQRVGVPAVKTGYVADASQAKVTGTDGKRHYAWHEGQDMARHHLKVVTEAAKRHIAVNPHEPIKDTGLHIVHVALHPEVDFPVTVNVARTVEEADKQARGEDLHAEQQAEEESLEAELAAELSELGAASED